MVLQCLCLETLQQLKSQTSLGLISAPEAGTNTFPDQNCNEPKWPSPSPEPQVLWLQRHLQAYTSLGQAKLVCLMGLRPLQRAWRPRGDRKPLRPEGQLVLCFFPSLLLPETTGLEAIHSPFPSLPVLWAVSCRGCSCSAWKQKVCASPVPSPPSFLPSTPSF